MAARRMLCATSQPEMQMFVKSAMEKNGLGQHTDPTVEALTKAQVVNNSLLFKLQDGDWDKTGIPLGAVRALKDEIATAKQAAVVQKAGKRAKMQREKSLKEKQKL
eukprot:CAMPEP_0204859094 /NCGR_PEP_ID=MMETSP1347-20130617/23479_1 /ASSEMBLY_ACC=CAM_ASM_000690 /TAXON_ID=215587 /ORGANISM="Aplanochytrium stocchinoi, Strain GSBS06" /LENGTH=105 /DNA_ID=CAMNT_0052007481 /DNA_START=287 /DNA_END=604 /DNA_ORIENTATION=-